jgi:hypothetical protein
MYATTEYPSLCMQPPSRILPPVGGWLRLIALEVYVTPVLFCIGAPMVFMPLQIGWDNYTAESGLWYHPAWAAYIVGSAVVTLLFTAATVFILWDFIQRRRRVPMLIIVLGWTTVAVSLFDLWIQRFLPGVPEVFTETIPSVAIGISLNVLETAYLLLSKRVRSTFIVPNDAPGLPLRHALAGPRAQVRKALEAESARGAPLRIRGWLAFLGLRVLVTPFLYLYGAWDWTWTAYSDGSWAGRPGVITLIGVAIPLAFAAWSVSILSGFIQRKRKVPRRLIAFMAAESGLGLLILGIYLAVPWEGPQGFTELMSGLTGVWLGTLAWSVYLLRSVRVEKTFIEE